MADGAKPWWIQLAGGKLVNPARADATGTRTLPGSNPFEVYASVSGRDYAICGMQQREDACDVIHDVAQALRARTA